MTAATDIAEFLASRRAKITPEQAGLPPAVFGMRLIGPGGRVPLTVENGLTARFRSAALPVPLRIWEVGRDRLALAEVTHGR